MTRDGLEGPVDKREPRSDIVEGLWETRGIVGGGVNLRSPIDNGDDARDEADDLGTRRIAGFCDERS